MFQNGVDQGYKSNDNWWIDPTDPDHYRYADLEKDYPAEYFPLAEPPRVKEFVQTVREYYKKITGVDLHSIVEFGSGGGWYLAEWRRIGCRAFGYEGSKAGIEACKARHVHQVIHVDFRRKIQTGDWGQIIICTEVAEHIEPPFHGTLVQHLISRSDLVWFSSEAPGGNKPHLHHPGEMPLEYWIKLFEFFGYGCHMLPEEIFISTEYRGRCIFFNKETYSL